MPSVTFHRTPHSATIVLFVFAFVACEQTVTNPKLPEYQERMVMKAQLSITPDSTVVTCDLGRTMPLNQSIDYETTRLNGACITVERGSDTLRLLPARPCYVPPDYNYRAAAATKQAGTFSIHVQYGKMHLQGSVSIVQNISTVLDTIYVPVYSPPPDMPHCVFRLRVVPGMDYQVRFLDGWEENFYGSDTPVQGAVIERTSYFGFPKGIHFYTVTAMSMNFYDLRPNGSHDIFSSAGENPPHNLTGDGMGFFSYQITGPVYSFEVK
jgi:hypothetical protein